MHFKVKHNLTLKVHLLKLYLSVLKYSHGSVFDQVT